MIRFFTMWEDAMFPASPAKRTLGKLLSSVIVSIIPLPNLRKRVVPEVLIQAENPLHIVYNTYNVWDLGDGSYTLPELELKAGNNSVSVTGIGNITFSYQEAAL